MPRYPLGRHVNHDPRSREYPFSARPEAAKAVASVSWARRVAIFDQGELGSCTGNAAAGWIGADNALRQGLVSVAGKSVNEALAVSIYSQATVIDPFTGTYPPDDTGSDGLSVTKVLKNLGLVDTYSHGFSVNDLLVALQSTPVLIGIPWYDGMFDPDADGFVSISGSLAGGHEVCVIAYDAAKQAITFANSWGTGWGLNGYGRMTIATLTKLLADDGDVTVPHALVVAPTPPPPPAPPAPKPRSWWQRFLDWLFRIGS